MSKISFIIVTLFFCHSSVFAQDQTNCAELPDIKQGYYTGNNTCAADVTLGLDLNGTQQLFIDFKRGTSDFSNCGILFVLTKDPRSTSFIDNDGATAHMANENQLLLRVGSKTYLLTYSKPF
ncbi:MAG: hypothetical protein K1X29_11675 [Bdellovibrionales bacterium]|nr:hypothetical protein [Bdellovibrionales bacterium]